MTAKLSLEFFHIKDCLYSCVTRYQVGLVYSWALNWIDRNTYEGANIFMGELTALTEKQNQKICLIESINEG